MNAEPFDISRITDYLFISSWPRSRHLETIASNKIRLVLAMHLIPPYYLAGRTHTRLLWLPTFDNPAIKMPLSLLRLGVKAALPIIHKGDSVLTHCREGRHRSVAMACCVLIGMGYSADEAMRLVQEKRTIADPQIWYIRERIIRFEQLWNSKELMK